MKNLDTAFALRLASALALAALAAALVSQHVFGLRPCAWCVLQRVLLLLTAIACWFSSCSRSQIVRLTGVGAGLAFCADGIAAAWYQYTVANHLFSCAQTTADRLVSWLGLDAAAPWLFGIYADCSQARATLLGVEYALWGLAVFVGLAILLLWGAKVRAR